MLDLTFRTFYGEEINQVIESLAELRIAVFYDFPYLYEGSLAYEKEYLKIYSQSEHAFLFSVFYEGKMIGATTAIPLVNESDEVQLPFKEAGYDLGAVFYFGESILLKEFRGLGLGHRFFDEREAFARSFDQYTHTCFCAVDRGVNHPAEPTDYRKNDSFWLKRGYHKDDSLKSYFEWPDVGTTESTAKPMIYWLKKL